MRWNKEKLLFGGALIVFGFVAFRSASTVGSSGVEASRLKLSSPPPASLSAIPTGSELAYYATNFAPDARNPFIEFSNWRSAAPDPLETPIAAPLSRRVPLPAPVFRAFRVPPLRELSMPIVSDDDDLMGGQ